MRKKKDNGLMFPKLVRKKKHMKHKASILGSEKGICYLCDKLYGDRNYKQTEYHHIMYGGGKRRNSEELGLTVYLCMDHHKDGPEAVHNNRKIREFLCREAQAAFEREHTREEWVDMEFKDYLTEMPENVDFTKCGEDFEKNGKNQPKSTENVDFTKCDGHFEQSKESNGAAGGVEIGEYIGYIWDSNLAYGYVLGYGPGGSVWVGEEPDAWVKRLVDIQAILR